MTTISDLFTLEYGHSLEFNRLVVSDKSDAVNFVSRTTRNNGVSSRVAPVSGVIPASAGTITVALNGQGGAGEAFLQPFPYYTGFHLMVLTAKEPMTDLEKLWWVRCIAANRFRFGFGRQANKTLSSLVLPSPQVIPAWVAKASLDPFKDATASLSSEVQAPVSATKWAAFRYDDLFEIKKGQRVTKSAMSPGKTPFVSAIFLNNGHRQYIDVKPNHKSGTITVNYNGSVAEAFYQPEPFWASDDVNVLYPKFAMNKFVAMFICTLIRQERFRFNYGRKWHLERMVNSIIKLPVTDDGEPALDYMDSYIKSMPYSKSI